MYWYTRYLRFDPAERAAAGPAEHPALVSEDSNSNISQEKWGDYYMNEDDYAMQEPGSEPESDSDFEYEGGRTKKGKGKKAQAKSRPSKSSSSRSRRQEEEKASSSDRKGSFDPHLCFNLVMFRLKQILETQYSWTTSTPTTSQHASSSSTDDTNSCDGNAWPDWPPSSSRTQWATWTHGSCNAWTLWPSPTNSAGPSKDHEGNPSQ